MIDLVYVVYSADILGSTLEIERMSPASHLPAGYPDGSPERALRTQLAAKFAQTEGDEGYSYA
jgi:hypothetical protein